VLDRFVNFSIIGVANTVIHLAVVVALVEGLQANPVLANCIAFIVANLFSFYANGRWNYPDRFEHRRYGRFLAVSLIGLGVTAGASGIAAALGWHYLLGTGLVFVCLPVLTFFAHERWTWS
jgi:putative flippase GtrA